MSTMANTYDISILNESGVTRSYLLFVELPTVAGGNGATVFTNVYMAANPIVSRDDGSSSVTFTIARQFYGICGTSVEDLRTGVKVSTSDYEAVTLGVGDTPSTAGTTLNLITTDGVSFKEPIGQPSAPADAYTIMTDSNFVVPSPDNIFIGLGGLSNNGRVVPTATFLAEPSTMYNITPNVVFYIATGTYTRGEIIDVQAIGQTQKVDFTYSTSNAMTFIQKNNGTYVLAREWKAQAAKLARLSDAKFARLSDAKFAELGAHAHHEAERAQMPRPMKV